MLNTPTFILAATAPEGIPPLIILLIGIAIVIGMIVALKINAFVALITAAIAVSLMAPGDLALKISRVADAFGSTAASIGIVIALAAIIGQAMMQSGAADRVVRLFLNLFGEKKANIALMGSGFTLSIPVFFDTAFYLLVPLARSMHRKTGTHYLRYLMAIAAGGAITHTLVPPTPGPLFIASQLDVDLGTMMIMGVVVAIPSALVALLYGKWLDTKMHIPMRPYADGHPEPEPLPDSKLPSLALALAPILIPILLITANSVVKVMGANELKADPTILTDTSVESKFVHDGKLQVLTTNGEGETVYRVLGDGDITEALLAASTKDLPIAKTFQYTNLLGNPNFALLISAALAVFTLQIQRKPTKDELAKTIETALMSGGVIILITAAGGAFGGMLKAAELGPAIKDMFGDSAVAGLPLLFFAFFISSLIKFAQGSSTSAMIVTSGMIAAMITPESLTTHPVYLAMSIGCGSLFGSWMNDSGFWIFAKMGGLTEIESLKSWTPMLAILAVTGMITTVILAIILPMAN